MSGDLPSTARKWSRDLSKDGEELTGLGDALEFPRFLRHPFIGLRQRA